jgi:hypothetical protein
MEIILSFEPGSHQVPLMREDFRPEADMEMTRLSYET